ncbi:MAG: hypothetical protein H7242_19545 [Microbacteriaceae bacterium]|nr:hypothetical protein [Burkholderiaceae bacterium]
MNPRRLVLGSGLLLAGALAFFGNRDDAAVDLALPVARGAGGPPAAVPALFAPAPPAPARQTATPVTSAAGSALAGELPILPLRGRQDAADPDREGLRVAGLTLPGRPVPGLFAALSWRSPAAQTVASGPPPTLVPTAPALPFRYLGQQIQAGQVEVFLAQGELLHIVRAKTQLDPLYRIDAISPTAISFTYLPLNLAQQLPLGASD